jgi:signal transduction histidine kinase
MDAGLAYAIMGAPLRRRTWREFGYAFAGVLLGIPAFVLGVLGLVASVASLLTVGLPLLVGVLWGARGFVVVFRAPARALLGEDWPSPPPVQGRGWLRRVRGVLGDGRAWRALGYCLVKLPLSAVTLYGTVILLGGGLYTLTAPAWWLFDKDGLGGLQIESWGHSWEVATSGAVAVLLFPWVLRALVLVDRFLARALLGPSRSEQRIERLESGRATLTADAAGTLRRLERDLHDGTQARLVSLGVTLSRVEQRVARLDTDTSEIGGFLSSARGTVEDALTELRDIVRGIHPPALDAGLSTAVATLASRSGLPVDVDVALRAEPPEAVASAVYFSAAELLSNAARHAGATRVRLRLSDGGSAIRLVVADDGHGGATPGSGGTGLAGLARRADALDGTLDIASPPGGPTTVTLTLPIERWPAPLRQATRPIG